MASDNDPHLTDPILRNMGLVTALWGILETHLEFFILTHQEIKLSTGLLLTANLSFRAKADNKLKTLVRQAEGLYGKRNMVAHNAWLPTDDPLVANVRGIRTRGKLIVRDDAVSVDDLQTIANDIHRLGVAFLAFMARNGIRPEDYFAAINRVSVV